VNSEQLFIEEISKEELALAGTFLQSALWASFKEAFGWKAFAFIVKSPDNQEKLLVLTKKIAGFFRLAYVPHGLEKLAAENPENLSAVSRLLKNKLGRPLLFIRWDLPTDKTPGKNFVKASMDIQPPDTVLIPLNVTEDELLAAMKQKTRYNIGLAEKKGVTVSESGIEGLDEWYEIYKLTAERDKIDIHSKAYYARLLELAEADKTVSVKLFFAEHEGQKLAGNIVLFNGKQSVYLYGATSNEKRNLMPAYALQWHAIKEAKKAGAEYYDLYGIPPADDPGHPMHGLYRFKTGFGGAVIRRCGCYDYPLNGFFYCLYSLAEKLRYYYYKIIRKR
jgi:lipid II:glycine glycyltransferase (peptidoglycan interpeptide bridge formation enzyme)